MTESNLEQALQTALAHHGGGRLGEAERLYREILKRQPQHSDALHWLGVLAFQSGRLDEALRLIRHAISIDPARGLYYGNLGLVLKSKGDLEGAIEAYRQALKLDSNLA